VDILDNGSLTAVSFVVLFEDDGHFEDGAAQFLFFFALAALSWGWRVCHAANL
jgi:hypothetical protein